MNRETVCQECLLRKSCLCSGLEGRERECVLQIIGSRTILQRGIHLFRIGEPLGAFYILRSGSIKTWAVSENGDDHIIRFHLPGDVLGLGAISAGSYDCNATSLGMCNVCIIAFYPFQKLAEQIPRLNDQLLKMMSQELLRDRQILFLLGNRSAPVRIASFLNMLSQNYAARGYSPRDFNLTMGRREIASYLGLAMETVSRTFSQLQEKGLINVQGRHIRVTDAQALKKLCGSQEIVDKGAD